MPRKNKNGAPAAAPQKCKLSELEKGKAAIAVAKKDKLVQTMQAVISAVDAGELDSVLAAVTKAAAPNVRKPPDKPNEGKQGQW